MARSLTNFVVPMSLVAVLALPLASGSALAAGDIPDESATSAMTPALATSNPTVLSNSDFAVNPEGGAAAPGASGTENYPPGTNGPEATGSSMNGSMMSQAAD